MRTKVRGAGMRMQPGDDSNGKIKMGLWLQHSRLGRGC